MLVQKYKPRQVCRILIVTDVILFSGYPNYHWKSLPGIVYYTTRQQLSKAVFAKEFSYFVDRVNKQ